VFGSMVVWCSRGQGTALTPLPNLGEGSFDSLRASFVLFCGNFVREWVFVFFRVLRGFRVQCPVPCHLFPPTFLVRKGRSNNR